MIALSLLFSCASDPVIEGDPIGVPLEIDMGSFNIRAGGSTGAIVAVVVVNSTGANDFTEDWYLSPAGASGNYAPYIRPSAQNPSTTMFFQYVNNSTTTPPTNPAPASGSIHWHHVVTKP